MFLKLRLLFLLLLLAPLVHAQVKVSGRVLDKKDRGIEEVLVVATSKLDTLKVFTEIDGKFQFVLKPLDYAFEVFYSSETPLIRRITIPNEFAYNLPDFKFNIERISEVTIKSVQAINGIDPIGKIDLQKIPMGDVTKLLTLTQAGVNSNNELTSNYNVRGGNYDENLVYVNGFLVNRPFLTRSGQQEGLNFINTALVEDIYFSSGGFQSVYGDKLSSVLDIRYKTPSDFHASAMASLLGVEAHAEDKVGTRFTYLFGARYRANGYLLNSLPTKGNYNPVFWDTQLLTNYDLNEKWSWSVLAHVSSNTYQFAPQTQKTDFGTSNEAYAFNIYFDGQERTQFLTGTGGTSINYKGKKYDSKTYLTYFFSNERETFDIQGQYYINELETDPSKEQFGDSIAVLGIGTFLNHARNQLNAKIISAYHDSNYQFTTKKKSSKNILKWGAGVQIDQFTDVLSEWRMLDSAGYSVPQGTATEVELLEVIKGNLSLFNVRTHAYAQEHLEWRKRKASIPVQAEIEEKDSLGVLKKRIIYDTISSGASNLQLDFGVRALHTSFNKEAMFTPRLSLSFSPIKYVFHNGEFIRRALKYRVSTGFYYQPPFYREYRTFDGSLNSNVKSQKSFHFVVGADYSFYLWNRDAPFKFTAEAYYKYLWDVNPYEVDNVRTRYFANNNAVAYATGLDLNLVGEFVPGLLSFFKVGLLSTKEDIKDDYYYDYYNAAGEKIKFGISTDQNVVDSVRVSPGYIRRPTDQRFTIGVLVQDYMPGFERLSVQLGLNYGSRLPYGPPDHSRYKDTLTMKAYFRVDLGTSYSLINKKKADRTDKFKFISDASVSLEVFNLLGINNVLSKQWVQDVSGKYYSIPNYLTQRRINLKLIVRI